jgi:hypothetical protein
MGMAQDIAPDLLCQLFAGHNTSTPEFQNMLEIVEPFFKASVTQFSVATYQA